MPKDVRFPDREPQWVFDRDSVLFLALVDRKPVRCLVTVESLIQQYRIGYSSQEALAAFKAHRAQIEEIARNVLKSGHYDEARGELTLQASTFTTTTTPAPKQPSATSVRYSDDIRTNAKLYEQLQDISGTANRFLGKLAAEVHLSWALVDTTPPPVVELTVDDPEIQMQFWDWYSVDDLSKPDVIARRLNRFVSSYLQARNQKLLEQIQSASEG